MILKPKLCTLMWGAAVSFLSIVAVGQLTVDATGPIRERARRVMAGRGGGIGRKLTLQITIAVGGTAAHDNGTTPVRFVLTNSGNKELLLPLSPHPGDLEPRNPEVSYTLRHLSLFLTSGKRQESILPGGAELYGNQAFPGTLVTLAPGESIRVLARLALPRTTGTEQTGTVFVAHAILSDQIVSLVDGQVFEDTQEVGSEVSPEYDSKSLLESPK